MMTCSCTTVIICVRLEAMILSGDCTADGEYAAFSQLSTFARKGSFRRVFGEYGSSR